MSTSPYRAPVISRRVLLRQAISVGLLAAPVAGILAACGSDVPASRPSAVPAHAVPSTAHAEAGPAEVVLFHHALGLTAGVRAFASKLRHVGYTVHTPDLYHGKTFPTLDKGLAYANSIGLDVFAQRGVAAADGLTTNLVYMGISLGVMPAQQLAETRPGARGAVLLEGCIPPSQYASVWPGTEPVQIHGMDADPIFAGEGDLAAARVLVTEADDGHLFLYHGNRHLFTDSSLPTYDPKAAALVTQRVIEFLNRNAR